MSSAVGSELLTVAEVADLLRVSKVTVARWMKQGRLQGYRVGPRAVRVRREDVAGLVEPVTGAGETPSGEERPTGGPDWTWDSIPVDHELIASLRPMTEERSRALREALDRLEELNARMLERRGGQLFPDSAEEIREAREEWAARSDQW